MASLIVWLCVHVSKFNTVCVVEHRGGIRAAERQQSSSRAAAEQQQSSSREQQQSSSRAYHTHTGGVLRSREAAEHTPYEKGFSMQKRFITTGIICPQHGGHNTPFQLVS